MRKSSCLLKTLLLSQLLLFAMITNVLAQNGANGTSKNQLKISGKIIDEKGNPVPGVSVQVKGGEIVAVSDNTGNFSATTNEGAVLQFTSAGYATYEQAIKNAGNFEVKMTTASKSLDDVVVV